MFRRIANAFVIAAGSTMRRSRSISSSRYRLVSSFAQTPRVEAPTKETGELAAPPLIGRPL